MRELGVLTGTSLSAILSREKGKFKPKGEKKAVLVALRKLRKREVSKMLLEKGEEENQKRNRRKRWSNESKNPGPRRE
jgi:hypothetical protein